jgi:hypothetical protein
MEVGFDTHVPGYGGKLLRWADASIGQRLLAAPLSWRQQLLLYSPSPEGLEWARQLSHPAVQVHEPTGQILTSLEGLDELGRNIRATSFPGRIHEMMSGSYGLALSEAMMAHMYTAFIQTRQHFEQAARGSFDNFAFTQTPVPREDLLVRPFYQGLQSRLGYLTAQELATVLHRFHSMALPHNISCTSQTEHLRNVLRRLPTLPNGQLTAYGDKYLLLHQTVTQTILEQREQENLHLGRSSPSPIRSYQSFSN